MTLEMIPQASLRSDAPALRPMTPRRVRDTDLGILVWIAVIIYFMEFRCLCGYAHWLRKAAQRGEERRLNWPPEKAEDNGGRQRAAHSQ